MMWMICTTGKMNKMKMKKQSNELKKIAVKIIPVLKKHGVTKAGIFGSYARGEQKKKSDVDILVKIKKDMSLLDFVGLKLELENIVGRKVDLVEYSVIKPRIKRQILSEEIKII